MKYATLEYSFLQCYRSPLAFQMDGFQPVGQFLGIGYGGGKGQELGFRAELSQPGEEHFQNVPASGIGDEVYLVRNHNRELLEKTGAVSEQGIRFLACCNDNVVSHDGFVGFIKITCGHDHRIPLGQYLLQVIEFL